MWHWYFGGSFFSFLTSPASSDVSPPQAFAFSPPFVLLCFCSLCVGLFPRVRLL